MRRFLYFSCLTLVTASLIERRYQSSVLGMLGVVLNISDLDTPIPRQLLAMAPNQFAGAVEIAMLVLVARRWWLIAIGNRTLPASFRGLNYALAAIGFTCVSLSGLAVLALSLLAHKIPVGSIAFIPLSASVSVPLAFVITELLSFGLLSSKRSLTPPANTEPARLTREAQLSSSVIKPAKGVQLKKIPWQEQKGRLSDAAAFLGWVTVRAGAGLVVWIGTSLLGVIFVAIPGSANSVNLQLWRDLWYLWLIAIAYWVFVPPFLH